LRKTTLKVWSWKMWYVVFHFLIVWRQTNLIKFQTSLYTIGGDALNREFKDLLQKHSKPVPPIVLLDLVGNGEGKIKFVLLIFKTTNACCLPPKKIKLKINKTYN